MTQDACTTEMIHQDRVWKDARGSTRLVDDQQDCALLPKYNNMNFEQQYSNPTSGHKIDAMISILTLSAVGRLRVTHKNEKLPTNARGSRTYARWVWGLNTYREAIGHSRRLLRDLSYIHTTLRLELFHWKIYF